MKARVEPKVVTLRNVRIIAQDKARHALWDNFSRKRELPPSEDGC